MPMLQVKAALTVDLALFFNCALSRARFVTLSKVLQKSFRSAPVWVGLVDISGLRAYTLGNTAEIVPWMRFALRP